MLDTANLRILIPANEISDRVLALGARITADYHADGRVPHLICVLKGGCMFLSDLMRAVNLPVTIDFIAVSSYGSETTSSGEVRLTKDLDQSLDGRDVLFVEDIVDTGLTLSYLTDTFRRRGARSVKIAALLSKPARRQIEVPIDYVGFEIPDEFVVGYGLDHAERYRNLPFIGVVENPTAV
ncbi:MAG: hypoxanthine phosphoribosyltransferase [Acidobacteria bacterium]|nr:hypoxanthine phosphoribosyltransferase [Acidobacteriota bacterium]